MKISRKTKSYKNPPFSASITIIKALTQCRVHKRMLGEKSAKFYRININLDKTIPEKTEISI